MSSFDMRALLAAIFIFSAAGGADAQYYSNQANSNSVKSIRVSLEDGAKDGCWTNLGEVKTYAEDKLTLKNYNVVPVDGDYSFVVNVLAFRSSDGTCIGSSNVEIYAANKRNNIFGFHYIGTYGGVFVRNSNANTYIIEVIRTMINKM